MLAFAFIAASPTVPDPTTLIPEWVSLLMQFGIVGLVLVFFFTRRLTTTQEMVERLVQKDQVIAAKDEIIAAKERELDRERARNDQIGDILEHRIYPTLHESSTALRASSLAVESISREMQEQRLVNITREKGDRS